MKPDKRPTVYNLWEMTEEERFKAIKNAFELSGKINFEEFEINEFYEEGEE